MELKRAAVARINAILSQAEQAGRDVLFEHEVYQILAALDIDTPVFAFVPCPEGRGRRPTPNS